jgi:hypothetical protein
MDIEQTDCYSLDGDADLIACVNVLEHVEDVDEALLHFRRHGRALWLCWGPWFSPWGRHPGYGHATHKTTVAGVLRSLRRTGWHVRTIRPRYWPWLGFLARWPITREWATWNVEIVAD